VVWTAQQICILLWEPMVRSAFNQWKVFCCTPALYGIIHDRLLVDLSREVIYGHKVFQLMHKPDRAALLKANAINEETYHICLWKKKSNVTYRVNVVQRTCMCKYYHKRGYCKHILYLLNWCNLDSDVIEVKRTFKYKGNTKRKKKMWGRIRDALPALQVN